MRCDWCCSSVSCLVSQPIRFADSQSIHPPAYVGAGRGQVCKQALHLARSFCCSGITCPPASPKQCVQQTFVSERLVLLGSTGSMTRAGARYIRGCIALFISCVLYIQDNAWSTMTQASGLGLTCTALTHILHAKYMHMHKYEWRHCHLCILLT